MEVVGWWYDVEGKVGIYDCIICKLILIIFWLCMVLVRNDDCIISEHERCRLYTK